VVEWVTLSTVFLVCAPKRQAVSILLLLFYNKLIDYLLFIYLLFDIPHHRFHMFPADVARVVNGILLRKHKLMNRHTDEGTV
jgi:hypothetical protein